MPYFIDVIIPVPVQRLFTYRITAAESNFLKAGMRVAVPFGKSKIYTGIVYSIHDKEPQAYDAKEINQILDQTPLVTEKQLKLWQWISNYYMCTLGDVMRAALPSVFILESETIITKNTGNTSDTSDLKDEEFLIYEALLQQSSLKIHDISNILNKKNILPIINSLIDKEVISVEEEVYEKYKPKLVRYVKLNAYYATQQALQKILEDLGRAPKQKKVVLTLFSISASTKKPVKLIDLTNQSGCSTAIIKALIDKDILQEYHIQTDRFQLPNTEKESSKTLNEYQQKALEAIKTAFKSYPVTLLHGVTSSGKTEIYVKLIAEALNQGQQVLYLLPEIALTTQLVLRLQSYFGEQVAVFHSKYSTHERAEVWNHVLHNTSKAQIVLGARSSIFLPFHNLGLVIVDEEHEQSFKQFDPAPRYHARDSAVVLAKIHQSKTLFGSATPSLESYFNTQQDKYGLVTLTQRHNDVLMPDIELVDIKNKFKKKLMKGHFSDRLIEEMNDTLKQGQQVILFQNRRGFSPIIECHTCGVSPQCPNCDVSLTYHQYKNQLRCHYCGYNMAMLQDCKACGNQDLKNKGFGTEQIEEEVKVLFPDYKVARMDLDTTRGKYGYEKIINGLEQQEIDILVGTQMLTKGLDFRHVRLVGIMNADNMLNFPDFRAHERSFQLMLQVSGRAGRTKERGKVLIQTYNPNHNILQQISTHNYSDMYSEQMDDRYNYKYPPVYKQIKITLKHKDYHKTETASIWYSKSLRVVFGDIVLGPESPPVARIRNQFHKNILLKIPKKQALSKTKQAIHRINNSFQSVKEFRSVRVVLTVDNY